MEGPAGTRALHHVVMPVPTIGDARSRLEALGFLVAADAVHPFGTKNACVFFADGTYIEPLAVSDAGLHDREAEAGNRFVARDRDFRRRTRGLPGFSGLAFASSDAEADHAGFRASGISDGDLLRFSRPFVAPDGATSELSFRLAFAGSGSAPLLSLFTCETIGGAAVDRTAQTRHPNGATGIARLVLATKDHAEVAAFFGSVVGPGSPMATIPGHTFAAGSATIDVVDPESASTLFGHDGEQSRETCFEGVVLSVSDLATVRDHAERHGVTLRVAGGRLVASIGDHAFIAFEEA